jgi:ribosome biogenesis protein YTM1
MSTDVAMAEAGPSHSTSLSTTRQIPVTLFTRHSSLSIPPTPFFIPANWRRFQLSELINKVLHSDPEHVQQPIPFDFLVDGEVLRGSLEAWLKRSGQDGESTIEIEYVRSMMPPEEGGRVEVDEWVSGLSLGRKG